MFVSLGLGEEEKKARGSTNRKEERGARSEKKLLPPPVRQPAESLVAGKVRSLIVQSMYLVVRGISSSIFPRLLDEVLLFFELKNQKFNDGTILDTIPS